MLPKYDSRRSHWLFFGKICSGLGSRAQRTLERIRPTKGASRTAPFFLCARHGVDAGGDSPLRARVRGTASRRQLRRREAGWEGSRRQSSELTNRNRIQGLSGGVTRQWTGTPESQADTRTGKSGSARAKDQRLTLGDLPVSPAIGVGRRQRGLTDRKKSAEVVVVRTIG